MSALTNFGVAIADATDGAAVVTSIFGMITDNIPFVLAILGPVVGWVYAKRLLNGATRGKIR